MNEISISSLTTEIILLKNQTANNIIEIGKRLIKVKESLPHGEWGKYLKDEVDFTERTAQKFIKVANEFGKTNTFSDLPISKLYALLDVPAEERETFIQENKVDEISTRQLQEAIKAKKEAEARVQNLSSQLQELKSIPPKVIEKEIVKQVTPPDYEQIKQKAQKLEESYLKVSQEANTAKNEARAYKDALEAKRLEGADILEINVLRSEADVIYIKLIEDNELMMKREEYLDSICEDDSYFEKLADLNNTY